jgi:hypothetical protein
MPKIVFLQNDDVMVRFKMKDKTIGEVCLSINGVAVASQAIFWPIDASGEMVVRLYPIPN